LTLSISTIALNEETTLPWFFDCCCIVKDYLKDDLKEVVIADGGSTDNTLSVIEQYKNKLPLISIQYPFDTFGQQKNRTLDLCTGDYIFCLDSDMTWTNDFAPRFQSGAFNSASFWDFRRFYTISDKHHYIAQDSTGVTMRLFKRGPKFVRYFHEMLAGQPMPSPLDNTTVIFDNCLLIPDAALLDRGKRMCKFSEQLVAAGIGPGLETRYLDWKNKNINNVSELPKNILNLI
jgi:glycosyltransferase involved in cell wall biosynthesis